MAEDPKKKLEEVNRELGYVEEQILSIADRLSSAVKDALEDIRDEASRINDIFGKNLNKSITNLAKGSDTILKNTQKLYDGSAKVKDIQQDISNLEIKRLATLKNIDIASRSGLLTDEQKAQAIDDVNEAVGFQNSLLQEQLNIATEIERKYAETTKKLGIFGGVLKGIGKIPIIGDLVDTKSALEAARDATDKTGSGLKGLKAGLGNLKGQVMQSITNPANIALFAFTQFLDALKSADKATGDLAKDFNVTYNEAANIREELIQIGNLSGNIALNARALQESMVAVGKSLGSNAMLNQADLETFTELREMAGYTNEELVGIQKLTLATGGNLKNNTKQFLGTVSALNAQNKLTVNEKQLLKEVANTSAAIKLSVGGTTEGLAKAAFQAKQFGINLDQADRIAESLLDFESSITNELSAELITGKDLNLEKARLLALNGDIAGASAEILQQVKGSAEFTKMNRIQQEALAKAVGMSREDLAASLVEREALNKLGEKDAASAKAKFDLLVKEKGYAAAVAEMGDDQYANQLKQQSIQERFNQSVEKLKEIFISIAEPVLQILSPFMDLLNVVLPGINASLQVILTPIRWLAAGVGEIVSLFQGGEVTLGGMLKLAGGLVGTFATYRAIMLGITAQKMVQGSLDARELLLGKSKLAQLVAQAVAWAIMNPFTALAGLAIAGGVGAAVYSSMKDGEIDLKKGPIMTGEFGSVQLNPADKAMYGADGTIKVGTNLGGKNNQTSAPQQDLSPLLEEMRAMRQEAAKANTKPVVVENSMDGTKFGTAVAINKYKIQ